MWLLSTRQRPELAAECLAACTENGMTARGVFYVDDAELGAYSEIQFPDNWIIHVAGQHAGLSAALQWGLAAYPDEATYGWIADDMRPLTPGWDRLLEAAAGCCWMSQAQDLWVAPQFPAEVRTGEPTAGQCWGGDLIRAAGWWALPGTFQGGTDVAWQHLIRRLGRMRFLEEVTVEHRHWRTGKRPKDALDTDMNDANGHSHTEHDVAHLYAWLKSPDFGHTLRLIRTRCPA